MSPGHPNGMERRQVLAQITCDSKPLPPNPPRHFLGHGELLLSGQLEPASKVIRIHLQRDAIVPAA